MTLNAQNLGFYAGNTRQGTVTLDLASPVLVTRQSWPTSLTVIRVGLGRVVHISQIPLVGNQA